MSCLKFRNIPKPLKEKNKEKEDTLFLYWSCVQRFSPQKIESHLEEAEK
jgi:hypothetical protein